MDEDRKKATAIIELARFNERYGPLTELAVKASGRLSSTSRAMQATFAASRLDEIARGYQRSADQIAAGLSRIGLTSGAKAIQEAIDKSSLPAIGRSFDSTIASLASLNLPIFDALEKAARGINFKSIADRFEEANSFIVPNTDSMSILSRHAAQMVEPHRAFVNDFEKWQQSLSIRMDRIGGAWVAPGYADQSAYAFGTLSKLGDTLRLDSPFAPATRTFVEAEFGDVVDFHENTDIDAREISYDEAGRDPALVAFPNPEYPIILRAAGLNFEIPFPPTPQPIENADGPAVFSYAHHQTLCALELHLRHFVSDQLAMTSAGARWIRQRVPGDLRQRWEERRGEIRAAGRPVFDLIHYADFNDLAQIITQTNNWNDVFKAVFQDKDGVQVSLRRLSPLRNNDAHNRPFGPTEILYLTAEAMRLLRAIGVVKLST